MNLGLGLGISIGDLNKGIRIECWDWGFFRWGTHLYIQLFPFVSSFVSSFVRSFVSSLVRPQFGTKCPKPGTKCPKLGTVFQDVKKIFS